MASIAKTANDELILAEFKDLISEPTEHMRQSLAEWLLDSSYRDLMTKDPKVIASKLREQFAKLTKDDEDASRVLASTLSDDQWWREVRPQERESPEDAEWFEMFTAFETAFHGHGSSGLIHIRKNSNEET